MTNNKSDLISVIIPTYNRAHVLGRAVKSVLAQTHQNFELLIVDDGSTDDTVGLINSFADPRIQLICFTQNRGVNAARNAGMEKAGGAWIAFLDSDDEYFSDALESIWRYASSAPENVGVVEFNAFNASTNKEMGYRPLDKYWDTAVASYEDVVLRKGVVGDHFLSMRPSVIRDGLRFDEWINGLEGLFWAQVAKHWSFLRVNRVIGIYHRGEFEGNHLSRNREVRWPENFARGYRQWLKDQEELLQKYPRKRAQLCARIALCYGLMGQRRLAAQWIYRALKADPSHFWSPIKTALPATLLGKTGYRLTSEIDAVIGNSGKG